MNDLSEATYYGTVTFKGHKIELYRLKKKEKRTEFISWFAKMEGQTENDFRDTVARHPAEAIGAAILYSPENDELVEKLWPGSRG